jgi:hypothetical protein
MLRLKKRTVLSGLMVAAVGLLAPGEAGSAAWSGNQAKTAITMKRIFLFNMKLLYRSPRAMIKRWIQTPTVEKYSSLGRYWRENQLVNPEGRFFLCDKKM